MMNTSILPAGTEMRGVLSAMPSTIKPGPPIRWIHFHTESATTNREKIFIREPEAHLAPSQRFRLTRDVVTTNAALFGITRMLGILCELEKGPRVAVFQTFQESLDWLVHVFPD